MALVCRSRKSAKIQSGSTTSKALIHENFEEEALQESGKGGTMSFREVSYCNYYLSLNDWS